jgi:serine protease SohB
MQLDSLFTFMELLITGTGTLALLIIGIAFLLLFSFLKEKEQKSAKFKIVHLNKKLKEDKQELLKKILNKKDFKVFLKEEKLREEVKEEKKPKLFVLDFNGDLQASEVQTLREHVSLLCLSASSQDEVLIRLESAGGMVHSYGLASSQLERLKARNIPLTIVVDKVAASGGYMMACLGDKLMAAPFAILGSIGVVAGIPNVHKLLKKNEVDYLELTAGEYKRTLTPLGEITEKGKSKFIEQLEETHSLFKDHVHKFRPSLDLTKVATGEYWYGLQALSLNLIDEISTSDDYILKSLEKFDIYQFVTPKKKSLKDKLTGVLKALISTAYTSTHEQLLEESRSAALPKA